jgi:hypothetical protein
MALPDTSIGWVLLTAAGGHPGENPGFAAVRRWVAPKDGVVSVSGQIKHLSPSGDGVRGRLVSSRTGLVGEWTVKTKGSPTEVSRIAVTAGDTLDFVTDSNGTVTSDSFEWVVKLTLAGPGGESLGAWDSAADFAGPASTPLPRQIAYAWNIAYQRLPTLDELDLACRFVTRQTAAIAASPKTGNARQAALTNLCQQLLSSNEFLYVD